MVLWLETSISYGFVLFFSQKQEIESLMTEKRGVVIAKADLEAKVNLCIVLNLCFLVIFKASKEIIAVTYK